MTQWGVERCYDPELALAAGPPTIARDEISLFADALW